MRAWRPLAAVPCLFLLGCGASGPEVRLTSDPAEWAPAAVLVLPPLGAASAIPQGGSYPEGVYAVTLPEAVAATASALTGALGASTTTLTVSLYREVAPVPVARPATVSATALAAARPLASVTAATATGGAESTAVASASSTGLSGALALSTTSSVTATLLTGSRPVASTQPVPAGAPAKPRTADLIETVSRQYLDARLIDPAAAKALGEALGVESYLVTAILRYGPEIEGDAQQVSKGVGTAVSKTTDLGINVASSYTIVYYNAQLRTALIRSSDGAVMWDAASRQRDRRGVMRDVTQDSLLKTAVDTLAQAFPWRTMEPEEQGKEIREGDKGKR